MSSFGSAGPLPFATGSGASATASPFAGLAGMAAGQGAQGMEYPLGNGHAGREPFHRTRWPGCRRGGRYHGAGRTPLPSIDVATTALQAAEAQGAIPGLSEFMEALEAPSDTLCATFCHVSESDLAHALESVMVNGRVWGAIPRAK